MTKKCVNGSLPICRIIGVVTFIFFVALLNTFMESQWIMFIFVFHNKWHRVYGTLSFKMPNVAPGIDNHFIWNVAPTLCDPVADVCSSWFGFHQLDCQKMFHFMANAILEELVQTNIHGLQMSCAPFRNHFKFCVCASNFEAHCCCNV